MFVAAVYNQEAGNATLFVDGVAKTSQISIFPGIETEQGLADDAPLSTTLLYAEASRGLRVGAGRTAVNSTDGSTGLVAVVDEVFVYGTTLTTDELEYLYRAAQVCLGLQASWCEGVNPSRDLA